jgi:hypothetical protein
MGFCLVETAIVAELLMYIKRIDSMLKFMENIRRGRIRMRPVRLANFHQYHQLGNFFKVLAIVVLCQ